ncbi:Inositol hexakisphosphate and diphosphoinositol-pentakisphosphate kinase [Fusarium oxysporum f. sp. albedinis]|nr:Inositol hexakisphosphate and diphosphoinositol-pentakisphosphate kinase [Fusarium oxysporum f. sp. albedinis]
MPRDLIIYFLFTKPTAIPYALVIFITASMQARCYSGPLSHRLGSTTMQLRLVLVGRKAAVGLGKGPPQNDKAANHEHLLSPLRNDRCQFWLHHLFSRTKVPSNLRSRCTAMLGKKSNGCPCEAGPLLLGLGPLGYHSLSVSVTFASRLML